MRSYLHLVTSYRLNTIFGTSERWVLKVLSFFGKGTSPAWTYTNWNYWKRTSAWCWYLWDYSHSSASDKNWRAHYCHEDSLLKVIQNANLKIPLLNRSNTHVHSSHNLFVRMSLTLQEEHSMRQPPQRRRVSRRVKLLDRLPHSLSMLQLLCFCWSRDVGF